MCLKIVDTFRFVASSNMHHPILIAALYILTGIRRAPSITKRS
jgi:hypothetical protein